MGYRLTKFYFTPGENEQVETVVKLQEEKRSMIHGIVKDQKNCVVKDAVVKLFEVLNCKDKCSLKPITHIFTDECGQFMFGPLAPCKRYAIKVWVNHVKIREFIVFPEDHENSCHQQAVEMNECTRDYTEFPPREDVKKAFYAGTSPQNAYGSYEDDGNYEIVEELNDE